jgi:histidinol-phosphate aminotransferase
LRRLHLNEASIPPSPAAISAMRRAVAGAHHYPDHEPTALADALSVRTDVPAGRIVFGNGSSEVLVAAVQVALRDGDEAVIAVPSFPLYEKAIGWQRGRTVAVPTRGDGTPDVPAMLRAIGPRCRIVIAATPNNPTGGLMTAEDVRALAAGVPDDVLLVLDEAYYEFGRFDGAPENLPLLSGRGGRWVITRTFSKAHGLAGIRIGYGLCGSTRLADEFRSWRANFSVNSVAQAGALAALADDAHTDGVLAINARERSRLIAGLRALGLDPLPTATNFVTVAVARPASEVVKALQVAGVQIMALSWPGMQSAIRVSVGTSSDTDVVLMALGGALGIRAASKAPLLRVVG